MNSIRMYSRLALLSFAAMTTLAAQSQSFRSAYFIKGDHYRQQFLNPALLPTYGWISTPLPGGELNAAINSSSIGFKDIKKIIKGDNPSGYFKNKGFMNNLDVNNRLNANFDWSILSAGWYRGKNFWLLGFGLRNTIGASISKSLFEFMNIMDGVYVDDWRSLDNLNATTGGQSLRIMSYWEISTGYSRKINERLSLGGRVKALIGVGDFRMDIDNIHVKSQVDGMQGVMSQFHQNNRSNLKWKADILVDANMQYSTALIDLEKEQSTGYITGMNFGNSGASGYGMSVDFGVSYRPSKRLALSASVLDLGFIQWSQNTTRYAESHGTDSFRFDENNSSEVYDFINLVKSTKIFNFDLLKMEVDEEKSRSYKTSLHSTILVGAEYTLTQKITVGALYSARFVYPKTLNELSVSVGYHRSELQSVVASYSLWQGQGIGRTFGLAAKLGCLMLGTDYMYLGKKSRNLSAFIGFSIPLRHIGSKWKPIKSQG